MIQSTDQSPPQPPVQLDYSRHQTSFLRRHARRIRFALALAILAALAAWFGPPISRHLLALSAQRRLASYTAPQDFEVMNFQEVPVDRGFPPGSTQHSIQHATPAPWRNVIQSPPFLDAIPLYVGPLQSHSGPQRLIHVFFAGAYMVPPGTLLPSPAQRSCLVVDVYEPATITHPPKRIQRDTGMGFGIPNCAQQTIFAAQPDPTDRSAILVRYTSSAGGGNIQIQLMPDDSVRLQVLNGPAVFVPTQPLNLPP